MPKPNAEGGRIPARLRLKSEASIRLPLAAEGSHLDAVEVSNGIAIREPRTLDGTAERSVVRQSQTAALIERG